MLYRTRHDTRKAGYDRRRIRREAILRKLRYLHTYAIEVRQ